MVPVRPDAAAGDGVVHLLFLTARPEPDRVSALTSQDWGPDAVAVRGSDVAIRYAVSMHKSRLQHAAVLRRLGVDGTARNWRTVQALVALADESPAS